MFHLPRLLILQLRNVLKRAFTGRDRTSGWVRFQATTTGLRIQAASHDVAIGYRDNLSHQPAEFAIPLDLLAACEGKADDSVTFQVAEDGSLRIHWDDHGIPQQRNSDKPPKNLASFVPEPTDVISNEPGLLRALADATETTDPNSSRFALGCIRLRGASGSIATTDGRQLLMQSGYQFPWENDLLVPGNSFFACRDLPQELPVAVGLAGDGAMFSIGPWSIWLRINKDGRFPTVDDLLRKPESAKSHLTIDKRDAEFAIDALKRLPIWSEASHPVTLDLSEAVVIRAQADKSIPPTELLLARSSHTGESVRVVTNGEQVRRALLMGFSEIYLHGPELVTVAADGRRQYLWMPFESGGAVLPHADSRRINSFDFAANARPQRQTSPAKPAPLSVSKEPKPNMTTSIAPANAATPSSPIEQAVAVRAVLREVMALNNELVRTLKRQKRQSRLVESTLNSLKQLQDVA